jgi:putative transposase
LREQENGLGTADVCRKHGISSATFYKWKAKYGGLQVSDARRLKKLLADAMLDNSALKDLLGKMYGPPRPCKGSRHRRRRFQLHKCIRPLASGPLLQPGHDEIRARRSQ